MIILVRGGGGNHQYQALNESPGISTCITEKAQGLLDQLKTLFYFHMTIAWGRDHISQGGGGAQHWALTKSPGISTCITEKAQRLLDWLKTFFCFPMTIAWGLEDQC